MYASKVMKSIDNAFSNRGPSGAGSLLFSFIETGAFPQDAFVSCPVIAGDASRFFLQPVWLLA